MDAMLTITVGVGFAYITGRCYNSVLGKSIVRTDLKNKLVFVDEKAHNLSLNTKDFLESVSNYDCDTITTLSCIHRSLERSQSQASVKRDEESRKKEIATPERVAKVEPTIKHMPQPTVQYTPQPTVQYTPQPTVQYTPQPTVQYTPQPTVQYTPQPTVQPKIKQMSLPKRHSEPTSRKIQVSGANLNVHTMPGDGHCMFHSFAPSRVPDFINKSYNERLAIAKEFRKDAGSLVHEHYASLASGGLHAMQLEDDCEFSKKWLGDHLFNTNISAPFVCIELLSMIHKKDILVVDLNKNTLFKSSECESYITNENDSFVILGYTESSINVNMSHFDAISVNGNFVTKKTHPVWSMLTKDKKHEKKRDQESKPKHEKKRDQESKPKHEKKRDQESKPKHEKKRDQESKPKHEKKRDQESKPKHEKKRDQESKPPST